MEKLLLNVLDQLFIEIESSASDVLFHKPLLYKVVGCLKKAESTVYANASLSPDLQIAAQSSNFFSDSHESDVVLTDCCSYGWRTGHQSAGECHISEIWFQEKLSKKWRQAVDSNCLLKSSFRELLLHVTKYRIHV